MRAVIVGAGGQLGRSLSRCLPSGISLERDALDISDARAVAAYPWSGVDVVVNAAAYTAVDLAETPKGRVAAWHTNATGVANLARAAREYGLTLVQVSSEYVFDGSYVGAIPADLPVSPLSVYGASKAAGEIAAAGCVRHYVVRSSWLVGDGTNFVRTMRGLAERGISPQVVDDQIGRLTFTDDLAEAIRALLDTEAAYGVYQITNSGDPASWADVAREVFGATGHEPDRVRAVPTADYFADRPGSAVRPANSVLDLSRAAAAGVTLPDWRHSLASYTDKERAQR